MVPQEFWRGFLFPPKLLLPLHVNSHEVQYVLRIESRFCHNYQSNAICFELVDAAKAKVFSHSAPVIEPDLDLLCKITGSNFFGIMASNQVSSFMSKNSSDLSNRLAFEEVSLVGSQFTENRGISKQQNHNLSILLTYPS